MKIEHLVIVAWYENLPALRKFALNYWLLTGDIRLLSYLYSQFLASCQDIHQALNIPVFERIDKRTMNWFQLSFFHMLGGTID